MTTDSTRQPWHTRCVYEGVVGILIPDWVKQPTLLSPHLFEEQQMAWTKPEAEVVAVTMEVTAYVATL